MIFEFINQHTILSHIIFAIIALILTVLFLLKQIKEAIQYVEYEDLKEIFLGLFIVICLVGIIPMAGFILIFSYSVIGALYITFKFGEYIWNHTDKYIIKTLNKLFKRK